MVHSPSQMYKKEESLVEDDSFNPVRLKPRSGRTKCLLLSDFYENDAHWELPRRVQKELDDFIMNPPEVEEGVLSCPKCKSIKTYSVQKQIRRADEGYSLFAKCYHCKHQWREN